MSLHGFREYKRKKKNSVDYFKIKSIRDFFKKYDNFDISFKVEDGSLSVFSLCSREVPFNESDYFGVQLQRVELIREVIATAKQYFVKNKPQQALLGLENLIDEFLKNFTPPPDEEDVCEQDLRCKLTLMSADIQTIKNDINTIMEPEVRFKAAPIYILK